MIRQVCFVLLFAATSLLSQQPATESAAADAKELKPSDVPMDAPVIVIRNGYLPGYCQPGEKNAKTGKVKAPEDCVITREDFERLFDAVPKPGRDLKAVDAPAQMRRSIGATYAAMIGGAKEARRRGLEKSPQVQEQMRLATVQILKGL